MKEFLDQWLPIDASQHGPELDRMLIMVHWLMAFLFVAWGAFFLYTIWRFAASRNPKARYEGMRSHFSTYVEAGVVVIEIILLVGFSIPAWYYWTRKVPPAQNPLEIRVVAEQFAWNIHYPGPDGIFGRTDVKFVSGSNPLGLDPDDPHAKDDIQSLNQLHLEVNRPVVVHITSKDVIHSFKLPVMRAEQDAIPGMEIPIHFTPVMTNDGRVWQIACAQLCGLGHYRMRGELTVQTKAEFDKWMASQVGNALGTAQTASVTPAPGAAPGS